MNLVKALEEWNSNKALSILENMNDGDKSKIYIWTVEKHEGYFYFDGRLYDGVWSTLGALDRECDKVKTHLLH